MLKKFYRAVCRTEVALSSVLLCSSVIVILVSAIMRTMRHPINWGNEIALLMFAWSTFLGADVAYRKNATVFVDILINVVPPKVQRALRLFTHIMVTIFLGIIIVFGYIQVVKSAARPFQGIAWLSYSWITASLPTSAVMMFITALRKIYYEFILKTEVPNIDDKPVEGGTAE